MADEPLVIRGINWRETFPFTNVFRAFRIAIHPSKLILALAMLLLIYFGGRALDRLWPARYSVTLEERSALSGRDVLPGFLPGTVRVTESDGLDYARFAARARNLEPSAEEKIVGPFRVFLDYQIEQINLVARSAVTLSFPGMWQGISDFVAVGPVWFFRYHPLFATLFFLWFLLLWSLLGGAIARIAAVHVARDEKMSVRAALRFALDKVLSFFFAPLIPLAIVAAVGVVIAIGGLLLYIPVIGPILAAVFLFLALAAGFIMALVLLGTIGGFNLMYPTVAVEGSDSFDAISRSFSYVYARPWRLLLYTLVAIVYGAITYAFVRLFIFLVLLLTNSAVGWFLGGEPSRYWNHPEVGAPHAVIWPEPQIRDDRSGASSFWALPYKVNDLGLARSELVAARIVSWWVYLVISLVGAYAISYYFSANTIIYYLMRREVDATEMDDVYVEEPEEDFTDTGPVVGSSTPVTENAAAAAPSSTVVVTPPVATSDTPPADAPKPAPPTDTPPAV